MNAHHLGEYLLVQFFQALKLGGCSTIFYVHPENWGNDPIWLAHIFTNGLVQPPTRKQIQGNLVAPPPKKKLELVSFPIRPMWGFRQLKLKRSTTTSGMDTFIACATEWLFKWLQILYPRRFLVVDFFPTSHNEVRTLVSLSGYRIHIHITYIDLHDDGRQFGRRRWFCGG